MTVGARGVMSVSGGLHAGALALLVGGVLGPRVPAVVHAAVAVVVPMPGSLLACAGGVMLFVAARRRR